MKLSLCDFGALSAYVDGVLSSSDQTALEDHLQICTVCRGELLKLEKMRGVFAGWEPVSPKPFFVERLRQKLESDSDLESTFDFWQDWIGKRFATAALVLISTAALFFLSQHLGVRYEPMTVDGYLNDSLDEEILAVSTLPEASFSKDQVLSIIFYDDME